MGQWMERAGGERVVIGGDMNVRTGKGGGGGERWEVGERETVRRSKDEIETKEGKEWCKFVKERGWRVVNGSVEGDREGEWTFVGGRGKSVIDYVIVGEEVWERVKRMEVVSRVDSDHMPVVVWLKGREGRKGGGRKKEGKGKEGRGVWTERGVEKFQEEFGRWEWETESVEEGWEEMRERIKRAMRKSEEERVEERRGGWWDDECRRAKEEVRRELERWKREGREEERYRQEKRKFRRMCEEKKKKERERWEREIEGIRTEGQVWEVVNRGRKKRKGVNKKIRREEWDRYFREGLGGVTERIVRWVERRREGEEGEEGEITTEEVKKAIRKLKDKKAVGEDGIPNEVWKYGGERVVNSLKRMCEKVWKSEGWPEGWKEGIVVPVVKKGEGKRVEEYRGVTLTQTAYKVCVGMLAERLRKEVEEKGMMPCSQAGFREGMGTMDNVYVLNYMINREITERRGKLVLLFVDLKAAFDSQGKVL
ncbi:golgin subfamily A member 6-like protein 1 [Venturia canescens]|uniref:golgin subfamily A member 6-like protein 1 n=1 Tax=Venturia canescens TaxID=32260 RepID=UPI001C9C02CF|nr:golgin subfamily A member 6-like protein 1 [Venturia canescens]